MKLLTKLQGDLPSIAISAIFGGSLSAGIVSLWRFQFDKNAVFAFIGAIVGATAVVLLSTGERKRVDREIRISEAQQIAGYLDSTEKLMDQYIGSPFKVDEFDRLPMGNVVMTASILPNLRGFIEQAIKRARHLDFSSYASLQTALEQCIITAAVLEELQTQSDAYNGKPDHKKAKAAIVTLGNAMNLARSSLPLT